MRSTDVHYVHIRIGKDLVVRPVRLDIVQEALLDSPVRWGRGGTEFRDECFGGREGSSADGGDGVRDIGRAASGGISQQILVIS